MTVWNVLKHNPIKMQLAACCTCKYKICPGKIPSPFVGLLEVELSTCRVPFAFSPESKKESSCLKCNIDKQVVSMSSQLHGHMNVLYNRPCMSNLITNQWPVVQRPAFVSLLLVELMLCNFTNESFNLTLMWTEQLSRPNCPAETGSR